MTPAERALSMVGRGTYGLGCGNTLDPHSPLVDGKVDCSRFALFCHQLPAHWPGLNRTPHATTSDDANSDSMIESALYESGRFFDLVSDRPQPGDILCYKSIWWENGEANDEGRGVRRWIGHESIVVKVPAVWMQGDVGSLIVVQAHGPPGCSPCISQTDGSIWRHHAAEWDATNHPLRAAFLIRPVA